MSVDSEYSRCIVCQHPDLQPHFEGLLRCPECGHVVADLSQSEEDLQKLYERNYFFGEEYSDYLRDKEVLQKNFRLRLRELQRFLDPQRHQRLLEIGCAYGFFLDVARPAFQQVEGIDVTPDGVRHASEQLQLKAIKDDFLRHDYGEQKFDVICMWDTIEHLRSPERFIERAAGLMDPGGLFAITTGDIESRNARRRKQNWRLIHPPTHVHYFTGHSLPRLLENAGFEVVYHRYCGFYRSVDNTAYNILVLRKKSERLYRLLKKLHLVNFFFYLNMYDIMYVIARRK